MTEQEFLQRFDSGDKFNEGDLWDILYTFTFEEIEGDSGRWTQNVQTILEIGGRYFALDWRKGLTEHQESFVHDQPYEVTRKTRIIEETYWEPLDK